MQMLAVCIASIKHSGLWGGPGLDLALIWPVSTGSIPEVSSLGQQWQDIQGRVCANAICVFLLIAWTHSYD